MVDVGYKAATHRKAIAKGQLLMQPCTLELIDEGRHKKGDVLSIARVAGIMAAKKTADLIPLCHPLMLTHVAIELSLCSEDSAVDCYATVETCSQTGVEMEALTAVQIALLTVYDMCKVVDQSMIMTNICLVEKTGGNSSDYKREQG